MLLSDSMLCDRHKRGITHTIPSDFVVNVYLRNHPTNENFVEALMTTIPLISKLFRKDNTDSMCVPLTYNYIYYALKCDIYYLGHRSR